MYMHMCIKDPKVIKGFNLELKNIVGEALNGATNVSGKDKSLASRMKECSSMAIYVL